MGRLGAFRGHLGAAMGQNLGAAMGQKTGVLCDKI